MRDKPNDVTSKAAKANGKPCTWLKPRTASETAAAAVAIPSRRDDGAES